MSRDWHPDRASGTPLFHQLYLHVRESILSGTLGAGMRLPSTRDLAREAGVARSSAVSAYEQLLAEGYVEGRVGAGTFVANDLPHGIERRSTKRRAPAPPSLPARTFPALDEAALAGDQRPFSTGRSMMDGRSVDAWRRLTSQVLRGFDPVHRGYSDPRGLPDLRAAIAQHVRATRAVRCTDDQVIVTSGTMHAIDIAIRALLSPGDEVWVEDPGYSTTHAAIVASGLLPKPVPVDGSGIDVSAGVRKAPRARAVFITPSHQFPLGVTLSMARRLELLAWARASGAWIVEDDYHSDFRYAGRPLAALQGLDDAERVIYVGTLNKALFPGLRIGYAIVPRPALRSFVGARFLTDRQPPSLTQLTLTRFIADGHLAAHIRRIRQSYRDQRDALVSGLQRHLGDAVSVEPPDQGLHLTAFLPRVRSDVRLAEAAREHGVVGRPLSRFYREAPQRQGLVLGFAGYPRQMIVPAVATLGRVIRQTTRSSSTVSYRRGA